MTYSRPFRRCLGLCVGLLTTLAGVVASGGGGPENVFLVVNSSSADSLAVANAFAALRGIPPINVLFLPWQGSVDAVPIATFRDELLRPILQTIDSRRLATQIDHVVYSSDFPWRIDFAAELPPELAGNDKFPSGSLTGMTTLFAAVQQGSPAYLDPASNLYFRPLDPAGVPTTTVGFRSWYGWGPLGELMEAGGSRYLLSTMLGVTTGRGNTVPEIVRYLNAAAVADGTKPPGTIYFVTNSDVRTTTRSSVFAAAISELEKLGVRGEIVTGKLPIRKRDVAGLMTGSPDFDFPSSGSTIVPGAICENLTSFGGIFSPTADQTPLSAFLRAGAAGSSGTVIEPYALQAKFPHAAIQVHYARGANLAEAFYQSVRSPYQLLVVGDPLCRPWATIPIVEAVLAPDMLPIRPGATLKGAVEIEPRGTLPGAKDAVIDRFELFVDGVRFAQCGPGERFTLDTATMADGHHELRIVAIDSSPLETQGRLIMPVTFSNHGRSLQLVAEPQRARPGGTVRVAVKGDGLKSIVIFTMGRVLGRESKPEATIEVPSDLLGRGMVTIRATGRAGPGAANSVNAAPVTITVTNAP